MPCYTDPHSYCHTGIENVDELICDLTEKIKEFDKSRKREEGEFQELKKHADKLTDMLCRALEISFENSQYQSDTKPMPSDIRDWWLKHQKWDAERKDK